MPVLKSKFATILILSFFPLSLALNLVNFFWMDAAFILSTLVAYFFWIRKGHSTLKETFGLQNKVLLAFICVYFLSGIAGYALNSPMQTNEWIKIANLRWIWGFFACYSAGYIMADQKQRWPWHFSALVLVLFAIVIRHYLETAGAFFSPDIRAQGFYSNPNYFAMAAVVLWAAMLPFLIYAQSKWSGICAAVILACITIILIATYTRTAWIAMFSALFFALVYSKNKKTLGLSVMAVAAAATAVYFNVFDLKERILYSFDLSGPTSQGVRISTWKATWHIFLDHPMFGVGFEHAASLYRDYYIKLGQPTFHIPGHAHNQFLDVLSGAGIFGLIGYLGALALGYLFFHKAFRSSTEVLSKQLSLSALLCIVALFGCSITETPIIQQETRNYVLMILGFSYGYLFRKQKTAVESPAA